MTDRQLECITAIADHKSLTGAAQQLYISQSSLSQMLARTEKELGIPLFQRTSTAMIPTYAGDQYLKAAGEIAEIKENLVRSLKDMDHSERGRITIGIAPKRSSLFMPVVLATYMKRFPDVEIIFVEEDQQLLEDLLLRGKVDVIFITHPDLRKELEYRFLYQEYVLLVLPQSHPMNTVLRGMEKIDLHCMKDVPFILVRRGHDIRRICDRIFTDSYFVPDICLESHSMDVCFHMVAYGVGATMLPDTFIKGHPFRDRVACYYTGAPYSRQVAIAYRKNMYLSFIMKEFLSIAAEQITSTYCGNENTFEEQRGIC